jgi:hypothetical protein
MKLRCANCGHDNAPGPSNCEKCGSSLKGKGSDVITDAPGGGGGRTTLLVKVVDLDIPFSQMVVLLVKWAIASIPAVLILFAIVTALGFVFGGLFAGLGSLAR